MLVDCYGLLRLRSRRYRIVILIIAVWQFLFMISYYKSLRRAPDSSTSMKLNGSRVDCANISTGPAEPQKFTQWLGSSMAGSLPVKPRVDLLIQVRRLVLFTVHQVNAELRQACVRRWANPLTASAVSSTQFSTTGTQWTVRFDMEPGRVPYEAVIRQEDLSSKPVNLKSQEELDLVTLKRLNVPLSERTTYACRIRSDSIETVMESSQYPEAHICICGKDAEAAKNRTAVDRAKWNIADRELSTWPLNSSFFISDYINYSNESSFLISPGKFGNRRTSYCSPAVRMLLMVISTPTHFLERQEIRGTYGNRNALNSKGVRLLFFLGTVLNSTVQDRLNQESKDFDDIVQANFHDSYHNLTLKQLSMYYWLYARCAEDPETPSKKMPHWVFKSDEDYLINVNAAIEIADANPDVPLLGVIQCGSRPMRRDDLTDTRHFFEKFYMPKYIYAPDYYIGYQGGPGHLLQTHLIPKLLRASLGIPMIHMEDVYITGMLTRAIGVRPRDSPWIGFRTVKEDPCEMKRKANSFVHSRSNMRSQWRKLVQPARRSCTENLDFKVPEMSPFYKYWCLYEYE